MVFSSVVGWQLLHKLGWLESR